MVSISERILRKIHNGYWQLRIRFHRKRSLKNIIIFESTPDLADNTKAVFDEMLRRGLNKKYKLVWVLFGSDAARKSDIPNVYYLPHWDWQAKYYSRYAKVKIFCNRFLEKEHDNQLCFYLSHGTGLKSVRHSYQLPDWVDYSIAASPLLEEFHAYTLSFEREKTVGLGFPRNDALTGERKSIREMLGTNCKNVIVWYPTFRQHNSVQYTEIRNPIPLLHDLNFARALNDACVESDTLIVIKPHFAQDIQYIRKMNLSNIRFIDDSFFTEHKISSYEFVGACDALVTDYSSIYYDYTLCDRPIAAIWEDIEEYKKSPGLVENYEYLTKGMEKIYTLDEFVSFIRRVGEGVDLLQEERREIRDYTNISTDSQNSRRVVDFIMDKANLE